MEIISETDLHEMKRRWARGEVNSHFFKPPNESVREKTRLLLESGNQTKEREGIETWFRYSNRGELVYSAPKGAGWYIASLPIDENDFKSIRTMKYPGWERKTNGSYFLRDAVNCPNQRQEQIDSKTCLTGITFIAETKEGPYVIMEGHHRLLAIYYHCFLNRAKLLENIALEVVLGVSTTKWHYSSI